MKLQFDANQQCELDAAAAVKRMERIVTPNILVKAHILIERTRELANSGEPHG